MRVLWRRDEATVREVHDELRRGRKTGYTTVLKLMQIMTDKGLVTRDESQRSHVYRPAVGEVETQSRLVSDLVDKAFGGSASRLVMRALSPETSQEELAEIRGFLDEVARKRRRR